MQMKKILILGLTSLMLLNNFTWSSAKETTKETIKVSTKYELNVRKAIALTVAPYLLDDQVMIPVRSFAMSQDCEVKWNSKNRTETIMRDGEVLYKLKLNSGIAIVNGESYQLKNPVGLRGGRIFVEAEFLKRVHDVTIDIDCKNIKQYTYEFNKGNTGFEAIFSDYAYNNEGNYDIYEMKSGYRLIPVTGKESKGLYLASHNRSDDLFMAYKKKLSGLAPNKQYSINISFLLATNEEASGMGIGGSPSSSVYVKCGASTEKPDSILDKESGIYRMNIDIGQQSNGGKNMQVVGDISKPDTSTTTGFVYKSMQSSLKVTTDESGCAYVIIGTDSGYEGFTEYYLDQVTISIK